MTQGIEQRKLLLIIQNVFKFYHLTQKPFEGIKFYMTMKERLLKGRGDSAGDEELFLWQLHLLNINRHLNSTMQNFILDDFIKNKVEVSPELKEQAADLLMEFSEKISNADNFDDLKDFYKKYILKALEMLANLVSIDQQTKKLILMMRMGVFYMKLDNFNLALNFFKDSIDIYKLIYSKPGLQYSNILLKASICFNKMKQYEQSNLILHQLKKHESNREVIQEAQVLQTMNYFLQGKIVDCQKSIQKEILAQSDLDIALVF